VAIQRCRGSAMVAAEELYHSLIAIPKAEAEEVLRTLHRWLREHEERLASQSQPANSDQAAAQGHQLCNRKAQAETRSPHA